MKLVVITRGVPPGGNFSCGRGRQPDYLPYFTRAGAPTHMTTQCNDKASCSMRKISAEGSPSGSRVLFLQTPAPSSTAAFPRAVFARPCFARELAHNFHGQSGQPF